MAWVTSPESLNVNCMVFRFRVNGWHEVFKIVGAYIMCRPTITELHHYYLIMIRMLLEVTSLSYKIKVLIIILENFSFQNYLLTAVGTQPAIHEPTLSADNVGCHFCQPTLSADNIGSCLAGADKVLPLT